MTKIIMDMGNVDESISKQLGDWPNGIDFVNRSSNAVYMDVNYQF